MGGIAPLLSLICASGANTLSRRSAGKAAVGGDGGISIMAAAAAVLRLLGRLEEWKVFSQLHEVGQKCWH